MAAPIDIPVTVESTVELVTRVPMRYRTFTESEQKARSYHRIPQPLLGELLDAGLPHAVVGGARLYNDRDLRNIALRHRLRSPQLAGFRFLAKALKPAPTRQAVHRTVEVVASCPDPGHEGPCDFEVFDMLVTGGAVRSAEVLGPGRVRVDITLRSGPPEFLVFSPVLRDLVGSLDDVEFHHLPEPLSTDLGFLRDTRLADCRLANHFLVHGGEAAGEPIRAAYGLFVARPFSGQHCWVEVRREGDDAWLPIDPFFLTALARWGIVDAAEWPVNRVPRGPYWRLEGDTDSLVTHRGAHVDSSLETR